MSSFYFLLSLEVPNSVRVQSGANMKSSETTEKLVKSRIAAFWATIPCNSPIEGCSLFERNYLLTFRREPTFVLGS